MFGIHYAINCDFLSSLRVNSDMGKMVYTQEILEYHGSNEYLTCGAGKDRL